MPDFESDRNEFVVTFPLYVLIYEQASHAGRQATIDKNTRFVAPVYSGKPHLAVFTDDQLAQDYRNLCGPGVREVGFPPEPMLQLLDRVSVHFQYIVIDPNPKARLSRSAPLSELVAAINAHLSGDGH
jgi:hypothetical protein